jgi:hypothetical protein
MYPILLTNISEPPLVFFYFCNLPKIKNSRLNPGRWLSSWGRPPKERFYEILKFFKIFESKKVFFAA